MTEGVELGQIAVGEVSPKPSAQDKAQAVGVPVAELTKKQSALEKKEEKMQLHHIAALTAFEVFSIIAYGLWTDYDFTTSAGQIGTYYPMFQDVHVMIFIGFGFLMMFMKRYSFTSVTYNFVLAAVTIQYSILITGFFHRVFDGHWDEKIKLDITSLITGDFAAGAVLISFGAILGKATLEQLVTMVAFEIVFYSLNESIGVVLYEAVDMGGSMYVHTFGAYFGLGVSYMLTRAEKVKEAEKRYGSSYTSDQFAMIGTLFLWMFWPSFNGALATGPQQQRVVINTVLSLTNSCVGAFLMSKLLRPNHKLDMVDIQNATLAGGVAVGSSADLVIGPYASLIIGFVAGSVSVCGYIYVSPWMEKKFGLHDTCGVHNLHGLPGIMGGIGGAISAASAKSEVYKQDIGTIFAAIGEDGRSASEQGAYQAYALLTTLAISIGGGLFTGTLLKYQNPVAQYGEDGENWNLEEEEEDHALMP